MADQPELDLTMMFTFHDALRRDLGEVKQMKQRSDGWNLFERMLHVHHTAEDDAHWPVVRGAVTDADDLKLLDEMAAEHAVLGPYVESIESMLTAGEAPSAPTGELAERLEEHLDHEERAGMPLVGRTLTPEQWMHFGMAANERLGPDQPSFLPWMLDGADPTCAQAILGMLPEPARRAYRDQMQPAYAARDWWSTT
jgi:hypothetical protein